MKKEQMVGARLPEELVRDLRMIEDIEQSDRSTTVRKLLTRAVAGWKLDHYARLYADRRITLERAANVAGVSVWEMLDHLRDRRIPAQYDLADLEQDLKGIRARLAGRTRRPSRGA